MITQPAKIIKETDTSYLVETLPKSACAKCDAGEGCGGGILAKAFSNKSYQLTLEKKFIQTKSKPQLDDFIQIGIPSSLIVRASIIMYLLPLLLMLLVAGLAGYFIANTDIYTVPAAALGLIVGVMASKALSLYYFKSGI